MMAGLHFTHESFCQLLLKQTSTLTKEHKTHMAPQGHSKSIVSAALLLSDQLFQ